MVRFLHVFMNSPFLILSSSIIILRTLIAISRTNWLFLWVALEINLLRFIPIIIHSKKSQETEAAVKYFLAQALGSRILLISSISLWSNSRTPNQFIPVLLFIALVLKLGIVPCHFWYPSVITSISWTSALILSTWQKLAPLAIISFSFSSSFNTSSYGSFWGPVWEITIVIAILNALIGGLVGINQSHLRTIIAYSSITHIGWIMILIYTNNPIATILYFLFYSIIISPIFLIIQIKNLTNTNKLRKIITHSPIIKFIIPILLLSLRGLPPLSGFIPKWIAISLFSNIKQWITLVLIIGSIINTYFYLNIAFNFLLRSKLTINNKILLHQKNYISLSWIALFLLIFTPTFILLT